MYNNVWKLIFWSKSENMKKFIYILLTIILIILVMGCSYQYGKSNSHKNSSNNANTSTVLSSAHSIAKQNANSSSTSSQKNLQDSKNYDPNKTVSGNAVNQSMIEQTTKELEDAGLPANQWAPSDIKKIITQSSQQGISVVEYAKENFH
ncbi:hypothetical protein LNP00_00395 [Fructobacillus sp. M158]|uniref:hypothetical protein n=1 Tax=Fructobacillus parabroussonetiae TaxID=2713174 RepID=UPI00200A0147|nr:hypothetical protein [Fructobacillus parabroussonetiae]MCK8616830.1 hypothetical protein [Fructobacillus parabroussonetiae]